MRTLSCCCASPLQRNLTEYFVAVDVNNMLQLYASMLYERRILICSSKLSTVSPPLTVHTHLSKHTCPLLVEQHANLSLSPANSVCPWSCSLAASDALAACLHSCPASAPLGLLLVSMWDEPLLGDTWGPLRNPTWITEQRRKDLCRERTGNWPAWKEDRKLAILETGQEVSWCGERTGR